MIKDERKQEVLFIYNVQLQKLGSKTCNKQCLESLFIMAAIYLP